MSLRACPAGDIVDAISRAAERWRNADFPPRVRAAAAVIERTGYSEPVVDFALDALFAGIDSDSLRTAIVADVGAFEALDGFIERPGLPAVHYRGVEHVTIVSSDTTIGISIPPMLFALCAKSSVTVKDRSDRLIAAFTTTLVEELAELETSVGIENWSGYDDPTMLAALGRSDVVVAFGGAPALGAIRAHMSADASFVPFGHRTSLGYVAREALDGEATARACARGAARDALLYDGEGCLSIHALFVERGAAITPSIFGELLAEALDAVAVEFPAGGARLDDRVAGYASGARFRAAQGAGAVWGGASVPHVLVMDPPRDEPPPLLPRTLAFYAVDGPLEARAFVEFHALPLEAVGVGAPPRDDVCTFARESGAVRIAYLGTLQKPPFGAEHGGFGTIRPFVRAVTLE